MILQLNVSERGLSKLKHERPFELHNETMRIIIALLSLGEGCFKLCNSLESFTFANSLQFIGDQSFYGCSKLFVSEPDVELVSIVSIGKEAFYKSNVKGLKLPASCKLIGRRAFPGSVNAIALQIDNSADVEFGDDAFASVFNPDANASSPNSTSALLTI